MTADPRISRRGLLTAGAAAAAGAVAACSPEQAPAFRNGVARGRNVSATASGGTAVEPFHGVHQAGVATPPQTHAAFVGLDLLPGTGREAIARMMRLLSDDARRLTRARPRWPTPNRNWPCSRPG
nr:hypothetical protein GCM10020093_007820 [Planobispora longispora]